MHRKRNEALLELMIFGRNPRANCVMSKENQEISTGKKGNKKEKMAKKGRKKNRSDRSRHSLDDPSWCCREKKELCDS
jgi:hypothetical protein